MWKYILAVTAALLLVFAVGYALYQQQPIADQPPPVSPPLSPFGSTVAGPGMVEPATQASGTAAIAVGSQLAGVITRIHVALDQEVKTGDLLFELDKRSTEAELKARQAAVVVAEANLHKLELQPRPEEVPPSEALVRAAQANFLEQTDLWKRAKAQLESRAISNQDYYAAEQAYFKARADLDQAKANLALLNAGAWEPDKAIARANLESTRTQVEQTRTTLELLQVRAPVDGTILQVNIRPGEYVTTSAGQSLILMGNLHPLHVRVNIDEEDLPRFRRYAPAIAKLRGDPAQGSVPLTFVRLEPYVIPKVSLTGANTERVDTRVGQAIYALDPDNPLVREHRILVGQIVDVFIDTAARSQP